jgi:hypothetical protein
MPVPADTIVATASPPGRGGVGIVRISGPDAARIATAFLGQLPPPRHAQRARFLGADGAALDEGLALYFPAPHSYTGEAVLELHGHGGPLLLERLIARALELGARRAQPGEFTQRAYLNDKLDLAQAEAVADLIDASSEAAARAALRSLQGEFSARVRALDEALAQLRAHVEATIDFPTDEIDFLADAQLLARLAAVRAQCASLQAVAQQGRLLTEGLTVVIAGAPNAGKSTLLNRLAGQDAAIVSEQPGTTRDVLREHIQIEGVPVLLLDTAGLRHSIICMPSERSSKATRKSLSVAFAALEPVSASEVTRANFISPTPAMPCTYESPTGLRPWLSAQSLSIAVKLAPVSSRKSSGGRPLSETLTSTALEPYTNGTVIALLVFCHAIVRAATLGIANRDESIGSFTHTESTVMRSNGLSPGSSVGEEYADGRMRPASVL